MEWYSPASCSCRSETYSHCQSYPISPVSSFRCLGFTLDSTLSCSSHVSKTLSSCFGTLRQLRTIRCSIRRSVAIDLVNSLVFSKLYYRVLLCCSSWRGVESVAKGLLMTPHSRHRSKQLSRLASFSTLRDFNV